MHLAYLAAEVGLAYAKPTPAEGEVFAALEKEADKHEDNPTWARAMREAPPMPLRGGWLYMTSTLKRYAALVGAEILEIAQEFKQWASESGAGECDFPDDAKVE